MKTVKEWLETLEEPYRTQALNNMDGEFDDTPEDSLTDALGVAFFWHKTPEDREYWEELKQNLLSKELL